MRKHSNRSWRIASLAPLAALAMTSPALAERLEFRVAMEDIPGVDDVLAGDIAAGQRKLEAQVQTTAGDLRGQVLATLCGVYVLAQEYQLARNTCNRAVAEHGDETAYNNRGVYKVHLGDLQGAALDFAKARPTDVDDHLALLWATNPGLIAVGNTEKLGALATRLDDQQPPGGDIVAASIENLAD